MCRYKNAGVAGYAETFRSVQSDSPTSNWYSYFENNVLVQRKLSFCYIDVGLFSHMQGEGMRRSGGYGD